MNKRILTVILAVLVSFSFSGVWAAPVSKQFYYEKNIKTVGHKKDCTFVLSLWDAETGGNEVWSEEKILSIQGGAVKTYLGDSFPLDGVDLSQQLWIQLELKNSDGSYLIMGERDALGVVPYSLWSDSMGIYLQPSSDRTSLIIGKGYSSDRRLHNNITESLMISFMGDESDSVPEVFVRHGKVGVNTVNPTETLEVDGNVRISGSNTSGSGSQGNLYVSGDSAISGQLSVTEESSFTDINMTNANVTGGLNVSGASTLGSANVTGGLNVSGASTLSSASITGGLSVGGASNINGDSYIGGRLRVAGVAQFDQKAGIGTGSPEALLHVKGSGDYGTSQGSQNHVALFENTDGNAQADGIAVKINTQTGEGNHFITFYRNAIAAHGETGNVVAGSVKGFTPYAAIDDLFGCLDLFKRHLQAHNDKVCMFEMYEPGTDGTNPLATNPIENMPAELISGLVQDTVNNVISLNGFLKTQNVTVFPGFHLNMPSIAGVGIPDVDIGSVSVPIPYGVNWPPSLGLSSLQTYVKDSMCVTFPYHDNFYQAMSKQDDLKALIEDMAHFAGIPGNLEKSAKDQAAATDFRACIYNWVYENDLQELNFDNPIDIARSFIKYAAREEILEGGVTYQSSGADYAEFLPKSDPGEKMLFGQIVGVRGGKVSKNTEGAEQIMAVSLKPVIVGNLPPEGKENDYVTVGFMGQLPVLVKGHVETGDYILASGNNDGAGIAVSPGDIQLKDLPRVLGRAWSGSEDDSGINLVDVAIGVKSNEWVEILSSHAERIKALENDVYNMKLELAKMATILRQYNKSR